MHSNSTKVHEMESAEQKGAHPSAVELLQYTCLATLLLLSFFVEVRRRFHPKHTSRRTKGSFYTTTAVSGIVLTYATEVILNRFYGKSNPQSISTYLLSQILIWAVILASGPDSQLCAVNAPALLIFDVLLVINNSQGSVVPRLWIIEFHRLLALLTITIFCARPYSVRSTTAPIVDVSTLPDDESVGNSSDDSSDDEGETWLRKKRNERFESSNGWFEYLKSYSLIIPYIFPRNDRKLQIYTVLVLVMIGAGRALGLLIQRQMGIVTDALFSAQDTIPYKHIVIWMILRYLQSSAGMGFVREWCSSQIGFYSYRQVTQAAFKHVMSQSIDFHNDSDSVELIRAVTDGGSIGTVIELLILYFIPDIFDTVIAFVYLNTLFGFYITFTAVLAGIVYSGVSVKITGYKNKARATSAKLNLEESVAINQAIQGWQTVASFNRTDYESERVQNAVNAMQQARWQDIKISAAGEAFESVVMGVAFFAVIFIAALQIADKQAPIGSFVILITYWDSLIGPLTSAASYYGWLSKELLSVERLLLLLQTEPSVVDKADAKVLNVTSGSVSFKDVHFSYDPRKKTLNGIDFDVLPGQTIGLVGETGAGKSTVLKLLYRFYDIDSGLITIDDQDVSNVTLHSLRDALGIVDQQPYLFNVSLMENLRYARLDASDEDIFEACKAAAIHDKILTFPDGYDSVVGNRGLKLSGGELQRVAIARVLLKDAKIVLLDEATSSVDTDTEVLIQQALRRLTQGRTTFVIAHRLSTIVSADQVLVFQDGEIIQRGTHAELANSDGKYKSLWSKQVAATEGMG